MHVPGSKQFEFACLCTGTIYGTQLRFVDNATGPISAIWPTANLAIYVPLLVRASTIFNQAFWENGATTSGNADAAWYDEGLNKLWSAGGTVAQSGVTVPQAFTISGGLRLAPGRYWFGLVADNITATYRIYTQAAPAAGATGLHKIIGTQQQALAGPVMPATPTFVTAVNNYVPQVGLFQSTLTM